MFTFGMSKIRPVITAVAVTGLMFSWAYPSHFAVNHFRSVHSVHLLTGGRDRQKILAEQMSLSLVKSHM